MKQNNNISIKEVETLCQLYHECQLSVQEETELEYILLDPAFDSSLINETRNLMGLSHQLKFAQTATHPKQRATRTLFICWTIAIAASVSILLGCSFLLRGNASAPAEESFCIAYVGGKQMNADIARKMAEDEAAKVKVFMQIINDKQEAEQEKVRLFMNLQNK